MPNENFTAGAFDRNLLHFYAVAGNADKCKNLAENHGFSLNCQDSMGRTALILAVAVKNESVVKTLIKLGASPYLCDKFGLSAIHYCLIRDNASLLHLLLDDEKDEDFQNFIDICRSQTICPVTLSMLLQAEKCASVLIKKWSPSDISLPKVSPPRKEQNDNANDYELFQRFKELRTTTLLLLSATGIKKKAPKKGYESDKRQSLIRKVEKETERQMKNIAGFLCQVIPRSDYDFAPSGVLAFSFFLSTKDGVTLTLAQKGSLLPLKESYIPVKPCKDYLRSFGICLYVGESTNMLKNVPISSAELPLPLFERDYASIFVSINISEYCGVSITVQNLSNDMIWGIDLPVERLNLLASEVFEQTVTTQ